MTQNTTCTNCQGPVAVRRPSASGAHFCNAKTCKAAKVRFYRNRVAEEAELEGNPLRIQLVRDLCELERVECHGCGLPNALPGWAHRSGDGLNPCFAVGNKGRALGPGYLDAIHPERVPS